MKVPVYAAGFVFALLAACSPDGRAAEAPAGTELKSKQAMAPGLNVTISGLAAGGRADTRSVRLAALFVPANQPASAFAPLGAFRAKFEGAIQSPLRAEYAFGADL